MIRDARPSPPPRMSADRLERQAIARPSSGGEACPADRYTPSHAGGAGRASQPPAPDKVGPGTPWSNRYALEGTRNAHHSNTPAEMKEALEHDTHWLEGDVRMGPDGLEMRHDQGGPGGLTLDEWLQAGGASGRGLKLDVKEPQHMPAIMDEVEASGLPADRLMFNLSFDQMERWGPELRERFPEAILAINAPGGGLGPDQVDRMLSQGRALDGRGHGQPDSRITYVMNETQVKPEVVSELETLAPVSVWNSPGVALPRDTSVRERRQELEALGVTGVIDLRGDEPVWSKAWDVLENLGGAVGGAVKGAGSGVVDWFKGLF